MESFRNELNAWYKKNYASEGPIKKKDYFCPTIKQMCVGNDCAFWLSDAVDNVGDHPCSINVIGSYILYKKWED